MTTIEHQAPTAVDHLLQVLNDGAVAVLASIGYETGLFETLATLPPATSQQVADAAGLDERYVREWLGGVVTAGFADYDPAGRTYALEFWNPYATPSGFNWWRAGAVATDGQMMFSADASNVGPGPISSNGQNYPFLDSRITIASAGFAGAAPRTASLALYPVPEPGSLTVLAIAGIGLIARRGR